MQSGDRERGVGEGAMKPKGARSEAAIRNFAKWPAILPDDARHEPLDIQFELDGVLMVVPPS